MNIETDALNRIDRLLDASVKAQEILTFREYKALYLRATKNASELDITEGWARRSEIAANGGQWAALYPKGEPPPQQPPDPVCRVEISATYGAQNFRAIAAKEYLDELEQHWLTTMSDLPDDLHKEAQAIMIGMLVINGACACDDLVRLTGSAILWLARRTDIGHKIGSRHRLHYNITVTGPGKLDCELMLGWTGHESRVH